MVSTETARCLSTTSHPASAPSPNGGDRACRFDAARADHERGDDGRQGRSKRVSGGRQGRSKLLVSFIESCYEALQGPPSVWENTFESLADQFRQLSFVIAEYNPSRREANDIIHGLPDGRGLGTFFWEPTQSGSWGQSMFDARPGGVLEARPADFAVFDHLADDDGL